MSEDKTLLPELLPTPQENERGTPAERVGLRAAKMLERFRAIGVGGAAAVMTAHCTGYGVVDPLPPPPEQCTTAPPDAFASVTARAAFDRSMPALIAPALLVLESYDFIGLTAANVMVQGGTLTRTNPAGATDEQNRAITLVLAPATSTTTMVIELDLTCGTSSTAKRYRIPYHAPTSPSDTLQVDEL